MDVEKAKGFRIDTLELQGFGSYKSLTKIEFSSYKEVAIIGDNGSGKSTLLEAVLFALYGQTRQKTLDLAISLGGTQARVSLSFFIGEDRYRISRIRSKNKSLLVLEKESPFGWEDITNSSIAETQKAIEETIGISFVSMVSTAFMRQGEADRFASATPAEKKDILIEILELEFFESIAIESRKKEALIAGEISSLGAKAEVYEASFSLLEQKEQELIDANNRLSEDRSLLDESASLLEDGRLVAERAKGREKLLGQIASKKAQIERLEKSNQATRERHFSDIEAKSELLERQDKAIASLGEDQSPIDISSLLENKSQLVSKIGESREQAKRASQRSGTIRSILDKVAELDLRRASLLEATQAIETSKRAGVKTVSEVKTLIDELELRISEQEAFALENNQILRGLDVSIRENEEELKAATSKKWELENAKCFSCGQKIEVSPDDLEVAIENFKAVQASLFQQRERAEEIKAGLDEQNTVIADARAALKGANQDLIESNRHASELSYLEKEARRIELSVDEIALSLEAVEIPDEGSLAEAEEALASWTNMIGDLEGEIAVLDEDINKAHEVNGTIEKRKAQIARRDEILEELIVLQDRKIEEIPTTELETELEALYLDFNEVKDDDLNVDIDLLEERYAERTSQVKRTEGVVAAIARDIEVAKQNIGLYEEISKSIEEKGEMADVYRFISQGASKTGIQSYLLSIILPELELVVNGYLEKMTQGEISLSFVTEKEGKEGVITTLEIIASTPAGDRPYSTFSGAERFIMDISMRMALARLLATRNGRNLRFFVVDEGWGSLDQEHTKDLLETIRSISDDFDLVVTVTHVPAVAEAFPVKMKIEKNSSTGSYVETLF